MSLNIILSRGKGLKKEADDLAFLAVLELLVLTLKVLEVRDKFTVSVGDSIE